MEIVELKIALFINAANEYKMRNYKLISQRFDCYPNAISTNMFRLELLHLLESTRVLSDVGRDLYGFIGDDIAELYKRGKCDEAINGLRLLLSYSDILSDAKVEEFQRGMEKWITEISS